MQERILVIRLGALGDLVLCFEAFQAIRNAYPKAEIALLTMPAFAGFARQMPWFDCVLIDPRAPRWRLDAWWRLMRQVRAFAPTRVYDLQGKFRQTILFGLLGGPFGPEWSGAAPGCSHPRLWPPVKGMHFTDFIAAQLERAGIFPTSPAGVDPPPNLPRKGGGIPAGQTDDEAHKNSPSFMGCGFPPNFPHNTEGIPAGQKGGAAHKNSPSFMGCGSPPNFLRNTEGIPAGQKDGEEHKNSPPLAGGGRGGVGDINADVSNHGDELNLSWLDAPLDQFKLPEKYALLIPGCAANRTYKRWPAAHYAALAERLKEQGIGSVAIGTSADAATILEITAKAPQVVDLCGQTSLAQVAALARRAEVVIGNDTGPTHLAAAVGARTLALMSGKVDPLWSAPKGPRATWLQGKPLETLDVEAVLLKLD